MIFWKSSNNTKLGILLFSIFSLLNYGCRASKTNNSSLVGRSCDPIAVVGGICVGGEGEQSVHCSTALLTTLDQAVTWRVPAIMAGIAIAASTFCESSTSSTGFIACTANCYIEGNNLISNTTTTSIDPDERLQSLCVALAISPNCTEIANLSGGFAI